MRKSHALTAGMLLLFIAGGMWLLRQSQTPAVPRVLGISVTDVPARQSTCHEHNGLPDSLCTPGVIDSSVTQSTIQTTICTSGYTKKVRPEVSYTQNLKKQQIIAYGYLDTKVSDYEEDHLIPLEVGGNPTDPKNLWPQPGASPNQKDSIENLCRQKVCDGEISLSLAQKEIATNWKTACQ